MDKHIVAYAQHTCFTLSLYHALANPGLSAGLCKSLKEERREPFQARIGNSSCSQKARNASWMDFPTNDNHRQILVSDEEIDALSLYRISPLKNLCRR